MELNNDGHNDRLSMVPLMARKDAHHRAHHDQFDQQDWSDQEIDEFTQDPLENVLMQMRLWPQAITRQQCVRSGVFAAVVGSCLGFVLGYVLFVLLSPSHGGCGAVGQHDRSVETRFLNDVDAENIKHLLKKLTTEPIVPGSNADIALVNNISAAWKEQGLDEVSIVPYKLVLVLPDARSVQVVNDDDLVAFNVTTLSQPASSFSNSSSIKSPFTHLTGPMVYVNYGRNEDYVTLQTHKVDVEGAVALIRLGKINLRQKLVNARKQNVSAVLLYPDPKEYAPEGLNDVFPKAIWLPGSAVRNEQFNLFPSSFSTGQSFDEAGHVPYQNINYNDAEQLLRLIDDGPSPPEDWMGSLSNYVLGKSKMRIRFTFRTVSRTVIVQNVIGVIKGRTEEDRYVLVGNRRSSLTPGSIDPHSGTAILLELARVFGKLLKGGWRPQRSILFCSWFSDADGPAGSAQWAKEFSKILGDRATAYLNVNAAVQGTRSLQAVGVPILHRLLYDVTKIVPNPNPDESNKGKTTTVYYNWLNKGIVEAGVPKIFDPLMEKDYSPFIHVLGIPILELQYTDVVDGKMESSFPLHNTIHENFQLLASLLDPNFTFHKSVGQIYGLLLIRLANSVVLPYNVEDYGVAVQARLQHLQNKSAEFFELNKNSLEPLIQAVGLFQKTCKSFQIQLPNNANLKSWNVVRKLNDQLMQVERSFVEPQGLPCLPEFNHVIFPYDVTKPRDRSFSCLDDITHEHLILNMSSLQQDNITKEIISLTFSLQSATFVLQNYFNVSRNFFAL